MKTQYKFEHLPLKEVSEYFPLIPLNDMYMGFDKNKNGFNRIEYWHGYKSLLRYNCCQHNIMFTYSNN